MQTVRQLNKHHPDIIGHGQQHFSKILSLLFFIGLKRNLSDFRDTFHQVSHFVSKLRLQLFLGRQGIL